MVSSSNPPGVSPSGDVGELCLLPDLVGEPGPDGSPVLCTVSYPCPDRPWLDLALAGMCAETTLCLLLISGYTSSVYRCQASRGCWQGEPSMSYVSLGYWYIKSIWKLPLSSTPTKKTCTRYLWNRNSGEAVVVSVHGERTYGLGTCVRKQPIQKTCGDKKEPRNNCFYFFVAISLFNLRLSLACTWGMIALLCCR